MSIDICIPYGTLREESSLLMLLGAYLRSQNEDVRQVVCDGVMESCFRDSYLSFRRGLQSCLECTLEQEKLAGWGALPIVQLSQYAKGEYTTRLFRDLALTPDKELPEFSSLGRQYWPLVQALFHTRFEAEYDYRNRLHVSFLRRLLGSAGSVDFLLFTHFRESSVDRAVLSFGLDFFSQLVAIRAQEAGRPVVRVSWDEENKQGRICHPLTSEIIATEIPIRDIISLGAKVEKWPSSAVHEFARLAELLGLVQFQSSRAANA